VTLRARYSASTKPKQLSDLAFQRHILVQAMILLDFLLSFSEKAKKKLPTRSQSKVQFTLGEEDVSTAWRYRWPTCAKTAPQTEWALQTKKSIIIALREGPDGPAFARVVDTVLSRDRNWVRWKEENCPEISRPAVEPETFSNATDGSRLVCTWKRLRTIPMGALDLGFLSESDAHGVDSLSDRSR
jgi:THO complex subunit 1